VEFTERKRLTQVKKMLGLERAHFEFRRGTQAEAMAYSEKEDTRVDGPWRSGEPSVQEQGKAKTKATALLVTRTREGASDRELWEEHPGLMLLHNRNIATIRSVFRSKGARRSMPTVIFFCGTPGTGKSRTAHLLGEYISTNGVYVVPEARSSGLYWDGYEQQDVIILDDFDGGRCKPSFLKQLCDRYPFSVSPIGRPNMQFNSHTVIITSNYAPRFWWPKASKSDPTLMKAVWRRFAWVQFFGYPIKRADPIPGRSRYLVGCENEFLQFEGLNDPQPPAMHRQAAGGLPARAPSNADPKGKEAAHSGLIE